ncbi:hypothetical protein [uncultured Chryseobacterium sp.]|jgi:hypothetical protein|uniref:hypothetical protein n=1 Tax=uncultured Chryseobacterium sp. TaxID=259322 RepID=UPI002601BB83|nr:hypothetical protein [uncultured Chryseobacterium sp.]
MIKSIVSLILLLVSVGLSFKHGWDSFNVKSHPESLKMMTELGIKPTFVPAMGVAMLVIGALLLFPKTFFLGNILNAISIVIIIALAINAGNFKIAFMEIPFLLLPLVLIWLKYPFLKN